MQPPARREGACARVSSRLVQACPRFVIVRAVPIDAIVLILSVIALGLAILIVLYSGQ